MSKEEALEIRNLIVGDIDGSVNNEGLKEALRSMETWEREMIFTAVTVGAPQGQRGRYTSRIGMLRDAVRRFND